MEHNSTTLHDYMAVLRRRRWLLMGILAVITAAGVILAFNLPVLYKSTAKFLVERPDFKTNLVDTAVTNNPFDTDLQIELATSKVTSQENIRAMIEELELFPLRRQNEPMEDLVRTVRENFLVETITSDEDDPRRRWADTVGFEVSYFSETPGLSQKVANHFSKLYLDENYKRRTEDATESAEFFAKEAQKLSTQIDFMETELANFKERNEGSLPELRDLNFQVLERTERELEAIQRDIRAQTKQANLLSGELSQTSRNATIYTDDGSPIVGTDDQLKLLEREYATLSARYGTDHPDLKKLRREIAALSGDPTVIDRKEIETSLFTKRSELADASQRYAPDHPDVRRLTREIQNLERQLATMPRSSVRRSPTAPDNPVYISLRTQLNAANSELRALRLRQADLQVKLETYQRRLERTPEVEREYKALSRDYEVATKKYNEMRNKLAVAETGLELETQKKGERYTLQKEAGFPLQPAKPNKPAIIVLAFLLALSCAIGGAAMAEAMDSTVRGSKDIAAILDMPPLAVIPKFSNKADPKSAPLKQAAGQN